MVKPDYTVMIEDAPHQSNTKRGSRGLEKQSSLRRLFNSVKSLSKRRLLVQKQRTRDRGQKEEADYQEFASELFGDSVRDFKDDMTTVLVCKEFGMTD